MPPCILVKILALNGKASELFNEIAFLPCITEEILSVKMRPCT